MANNFYGSPLRDDESEDQNSASEGGNEREERPTCCCKGTCTRKSGKKPGCPCRDAKLKCSALCLCGKKKAGKIVNWCANGKPQNAGDMQEVQTLESGGAQNKDGHQNMEQEIAHAKEGVREIIKDLPMDVLQNVLVELAVCGEGSLDFVRELLQVIQNPDAELNRPTMASWCKCGVCVDMGKQEENKCCGRKVCVTSYYMFRKLCLDRDVLRLNITARCDIRAENMDFTMNAFRKAGYRQFTLWKYGRLGKSNRRVLPSCVVTTIRKFYPSPTGHYMGFKPH